MAVGYIYIMTTCVNGLIKIGKSNDWKKRIDILEKNGYYNVTGLKCYYVTQVNDYDEKERLIHTIFSKSQVGNSELFALDKDLAKDMLEAFEGKQIYSVAKQNKTSISNNSTNKTNKTNKTIKTTFKMLNIPIGSQLSLVEDSSYIVTTIDDSNKVQRPDGSICTISKAAYDYIVPKHNLKSDSVVNGYINFMYNNKKLSDIRKDL